MSANVTPTPPPTFGPRCLAAIVDFVVLAIPVAVVVSFYSVFRKIPTEFLNLHPGESPAEVSGKFGMRFLSVLSGGYILASWLYFAIAESSSRQATPGKRICGLYVVDLNRRKVTFGRATARFFAGRPWIHVPLFGWLYVVVDCLFAAIPPRGQAIHDRIARCLVLRR